MARGGWQELVRFTWDMLIGGAAVGSALKCGDQVSVCFFGGILGILLLVNAAN